MITEVEYAEALKRVEQIFFALPGIPEGEKLELLITLIDQYENENIKF